MCKVRNEWAQLGGWAQERSDVSFAWWNRELFDCCKFLFIGSDSCVGDDVSREFYFFPHLNFFCMRWWCCSFCISLRLFLFLWRVLPHCLPTWWYCPLVFWPKVGLLLLHLTAAPLVWGYPIGIWIYLVEEKKLLWVNFLVLLPAGSIRVPSLAKHVAVLGIACKISAVHGNGCTGLLTYLLRWV